MASVRELTHYYGGEWHGGKSAEYRDVVNPATGESLARAPIATKEDVNAAVAAAAAAYPAWRRTPPEDRIQYLFKLKQLLEEHVEDLAQICTQENGKTLGESRAELRRAIENVEVACGIPTLMQGYNLEDVASGIDEMMIRQPLGVTAAITPFNFPAMIPFWFLPYAIACGNTFVLKASEKVPLTMQRAFELMEGLKLPPGVLNLIHGDKIAVDALLEHPEVRAISFVGSSPVAKYIYAQAAKFEKRVQCQGGAKNHVLILPDADLETTTRIVSDSAFGCAGQRCLAVSVTVTIGDAKNWFRDSISAVASSLKVGDGLDPATQMGPVITPPSRERVLSLIGQGSDQGAKTIVDGRRENANGHAGSFVGPTVLD